MLNIFSSLLVDCLILISIIDYLFVEKDIIINEDM